MKSFYIATSLSNRDYAKLVRNKLTQRQANVYCCSSWLDGDLAAQDKSIRNIAARNLDDLTSADVVIVLTEGCKQTTGGMWVECGYALGADKLTYILGPYANSFSHLLPRFDKTEDLPLF